MRSTIEELGVGIPVAIAQGEMLAPFGATGVPATVFVTAEGRVLGVANGERSQRFFEARARDLLERSRSGPEAR